MPGITIGPWLGGKAKGLLVGAILGGLALVAIYAVIRRSPRTWWIWGAGVSVLLAVIAIAVAPVFIFDHPSGYNRILMAMRWKAENLP